MNDHAAPTPPEIGAGEGEKLVSELKALEENKGTRSTISLFLITLILFFTTGIVNTDIKEILILMGVLVFHELGHLLAMKTLGYRDIKMFFIPFFGAAVHGKAGKSSSVRSCFVSLMGPFPGVVLSACFFLGYVLTNNFYVLKAGQILLLLNTFNLLPIMPLDGGRFIDVLFIRNHYFRFIFSLLGVASFAGLGISGEDAILLIFSVLALTGSIGGLRTNRLSKRIIALGVSDKSVTELIENRESFPRVISTLRSSMPKLFSPAVNYKGILHQITSVVETIGFVPAGWISKLLLSLLYLVALFISLIFTISFLSANVHEKIRVAATGDRDVVISEKFVFGKKTQEVPVDKDLRYHGSLKRFGSDSATVTVTCDYVGGVRHGKMVEYDGRGDTSEIVFYSMGKLDSIVNVSPDGRNTVLPGNRHWVKKLSSWVVYKSQPWKSNYQLFEK